jgi:hypothetical protein
MKTTSTTFKSNRMKKPKLKTKKYYDYHECAEFIAHKLGIKNLRDVDGKYAGNKDAKYKDFWHFLLDYNPELNKGSFLTFEEYGCGLSLEEAGIEEWQDKIVRAFIAEFGEDAEYWIEW